MTTRESLELFLIRHGETEWNRENRMQGWLDSELTGRGRAQARTSAKVLAEFDIHRLFSSPLGRARKTAEVIGKHAELQVEVDKRLAERHMGDLAGLTLEEIQVRFPEEWEERISNRFNYRPPGGESLTDMATRVAPFLEALGALEGHSIAIVSHGVMGRVIIWHFLKLKPNELVKVRFPNDVIYRLDISQQSATCEYMVGTVERAEGLLTN
ncbi:MAG: histidine phosphatase family protein [Pseudomonadales bacterium]